MATTSSTTASTTSYSYLQYKNKIGGLVSGMDIDSIMEKLMKAENAQKEKLEQQKQKYEWQRDAYREVNVKLSSFEQSSLTDYGLKSSWNAKTVAVSNSSATAVATSSASGTLNISEAKMATAGQKIVTLPTGNTANSTISSLGMTDGEFKIKALDDQGAYVEKTISYKATDKISDVMSRINSSGVGVTAVVSGDKLSLTANVEGAGEDGAINITADDGGLFQKLGVLSDQTGNVTSGTDAVEGTSGYVVVNGVKIEGNSNNYTISGYQITINNEISSTDAATKISSTTDTDKIVDKVKAFITTYNDLIAELSKKTSEKKNVNYSPLTDAQKSEMTTEEITKWEEKAKSGLLKNDSTLNKVVSDFRSTLSSYGSGGQDMLFKLGITTSATWTDGGKLELDEDKLRSALADDPEVVSRIFAGDSASGSEGIIASMRTTAKNAVTTIKNTAGSETSSSALTYSLGKTITSYETKISDWVDRLKDIEERYWNQFSAMETAINKANSQSSIFSA